MFLHKWQPRCFNKVDNDYQAFRCERQVKFQSLVLQIICGGRGNFFFFFFFFLQYFTAHHIEEYWFLAFLAMSIGIPHTMNREL